MLCGISKEFRCNRIQYQKNLKGVFNQEKMINQKIQNPSNMIENGYMIKELFTIYLTNVMHILDDS